MLSVGHLHQVIIKINLLPSQLIRRNCAQLATIVRLVLIVLIPHHAQFQVVFYTPMLVHNALLDSIVQLVQRFRYLAPRVITVRQTSWEPLLDNVQLVITAR